MGYGFADHCANLHLEGANTLKKTAEKFLDIGTQIYICSMACNQITLKSEQNKKAGLLWRTLG
jgi:hypothetical protein